MKLLFDHQLSPKLAERLADLYPDSSHVFLLGMDRVADPIIWEFARQNEFTIVTKDSDFSDLSLLRGHPPQVIWIKLGNCTTSQVEAAIRQRSQEIADFANDQVIGLLAILS